jgi:hypothetical protein
MDEPLNGQAPDDILVTAPEVLPTGTIRVVSNLRLQNMNDDGVTMLMLGDDAPEIAVALTPAQSVALVEALTEHREMLEALVTLFRDSARGGHDG